MWYNITNMDNELRELVLKLYDKIFTEEAEKTQMKQTKQDPNNLNYMINNGPTPMTNKQTIKRSFKKFPMRYMKESDVYKEPTKREKKEPELEYYVISEEDYDVLLERVNVFINSDEFEQRKWELVGGVSVSVEYEERMYHQAVLGRLITINQPK